MIRSFIHKGLRDLFETGASAMVPPSLVRRLRRILDTLDVASDLLDLNTKPGSGYHRLRGKDSEGNERHAISVNGPWRITFQWEKPDVYRVDFEQYH
jgi:proteic killer suppression protein